MKIQVEVDAREVLKEFTATKIVEHFEAHRDVDDLLNCVHVSRILQFLRENYSTAMILDELAQADDIEPHIIELRTWALQQKKDVS